MLKKEFVDIWMKYFEQLIAPAIFVTLRLVAVTMLICMCCGFLLACLMVLTHPSKGLPSVFDDDVPSELFFKVLESANVKYRHLFHRYNRLKKELLKKDVIYNYDLNIPLVSSINKKYTIDQCFEIINECLRPFGQDYLDIINKARNERWIDYYPTPGKRIGAYSSGSYDTNPFILMNFIGDYNSLSTMIHELGHSVHSYLSNHHQDADNAN